MKIALIVAGILVAGLLGYYLYTRSKKVDTILNTAAPIAQTLQNAQTALTGAVSGQAKGWATELISGLLSGGIAGAKTASTGKPQGGASPYGGSVNMDMFTSSSTW
jgi:hypothetical protein